MKTALLVVVLLLLALFWLCITVNTEPWQRGFMDAGYNMQYVCGCCKLTALLLFTAATATVGSPL